MVSSPQLQQSQPALESLLNRLQGVRKALSGWVACCPAHADRQPSLSIGLGEEGQILLKCFAGCSLEAIVETVGISVADLFPRPPSSPDSRSEQTQRNRLTLLDLAEDKMLPWRFLFNLGVSEDKAGVIHIPYHLPDGTSATRHRLRTALAAREGSRWSKGKGQILPYGLERLEAARKTGYLILVEGESDCWTLWLHGFAALGLPGAEMVSKLEEIHLTGINTLYILQEPDASGASFVKHLEQRLQSWKWSGKASVVSLNDAKDANELHKQDMKNFKAAFQQALEKAEPLVLRSAQPATPSSSAKPTPFTLQELLARELPPIRWAIPDILPEGLTLLAGKPKQGKSWLALSVALSIAAGGYALGKQPVTQGEVLYLALEDNERRLQARVRQLLDATSAVPTGIEFALNWPRLDQGGLQYLEEYLQAHSNVRLVIIDTWVKVSSLSHNRQHSQYESDYEALAPLKYLADTYRVSILAVHHLRKTRSDDVLDEITGSTGISGVVDGVLVLKRERGQAEGTLFVTGRDIEQEQQFALSFDPLTAQWTLAGNAEEFKRTRERQEIVDLLAEQSPAGMSPQQVAEALHKNYHTTRSLLRKMEDAGEIRHTNHHYFALSQDDCHHQRNQSISYPLQPTGANEGVEEPCPPKSDYADYADYTDYADEGSSSFPFRTCESASEGEEASIQEAVEPADQPQVREDMQISQAHQDSTVISVISPPQLHQTAVSFPPAMRQVEHAEGNIPLESMQKASQKKQKGIKDSNKKRCPHHLHAQLVRYDPSGQAWCDHLDCWVCYRLMKIGEALGYQQLIAHTGATDSIEQGIEGWSCFVTSRSSFEVVVATQQAIALCKTLDIEVPDLSGEVRRLVLTREEES